MSNKMSSSAKFVIVLTILGCVIPTIYLNTFSDKYLLYYLGSYPDPTTFCGFLCLLCVIGGIAGIFEKKVTKIDRIICLVGTLFCLVFLLYAFSQFGTAREGPKRVSCASNLRQLYLSLQQYAMDYAGYYPPANGAAGLETLRKNDYLPDYAVYRCPSVTMESKDFKRHESLTEENVDYVYIGGLNTKSDRKLPLIYDKTNNHGYYGNVLFADGIIEGIEGDPWTQNIKK